MFDSLGLAADVCHDEPASNGWHRITGPRQRAEYAVKPPSAVDNSSVRHAHLIAHRAAIHARGWEAIHPARGPRASNTACQRDFKGDVAPTYSCMGASSVCSRRFCVRQEKSEWVFGDTWDSKSLFEDEPLRLIASCRPFTALQVRIQTPPRHPQSDRHSSPLSPMSDSLSGVFVPQRPFASPIMQRRESPRAAVARLAPA